MGMGTTEFLVLYIVFIDHVIYVLVRNKQVVTQQFGIHGQHWFHFFTIMYL
jgi:hypothetical protein